MSEVNLEKTAKNLISTFIDAGELSLKLRKKGLIKKIKSDNTPVTNGDIEVNKILIEKLKLITPEIPIISEETMENKDINNLKNFWLVDPIDGTYDYINNLSEFTINAGLIMNNEPVMGLIYAPDKKRMFYSYGYNSAFEIYKGETIKLDCNNRDKNKIKFVSYSNKLKPEIEKIHNSLGVNEYVRMKSSLKFCVIAAGEFDGYVAEPRACEWDIAAGHAIVIHSGGSVKDFNNEKIIYGKKNFANSSLIVKGKKIFYG